MLLLPLPVEVWMHGLYPLGKCSSFQYLLHHLCISYNSDIIKQGSRAGWDREGQSELLEQVLFY